MHHVVRYVLARGRKGPEGTPIEDNQNLSGDDLERIVEVIMTDLPPSMVTDALSAGTPDGRISTSLTDLLASLNDLLDDATEEWPAFCQLFVSLLSTIPSVESLSENDAQAVTKLQARATALPTVPKAVLQEIQFLFAPVDSDIKLNEAGEPFPENDGGLSNDPSVASLPPSPEPWSATTSRPTDDIPATNISKIGAPPYITFLVRNAMETSWGPTPEHGASSPEASEDMPDVYKRIVHTAPEASSRPVTFIYHLLCASFGLLVSTIDDLQLRAVREEQQSTSMMDSADEVMLNLNGGQSGEMSDNLKHAKMKEIIARDGWRTWVWCFSGLVQVLQYWKTLSHEPGNGVFAHQWQLPVSLFEMRYLLPLTKSDSRTEASGKAVRSNRTL